MAKKIHYASAPKRLLAFFLDSLILVGLYMLIGLILGFSIFFNPISSLPMFGVWWFGGLFGFSWLYYAGFESSKRQATPGKKLTGLKVGCAKGKRIGFWRASVRYWSKALSRFFLCFGFLMIFFTKKRQALHDKIARATVVDSKN